mmetsp:Transcript_19350/g.26456  ORF Transcript_19350/g.26456 Transcript_19350/m.26456 type:complete len:653 (-) Transcript_19350:344-2302(-)
MGCCQCQLKPNRIYIYSDKVVDAEKLSSSSGKDKLNSYTNTKNNSPKSRSTNSQRSLLGYSNEIFLDIDREGSYEDKNVVDDNRLLRSNLGAIKMIIRNPESKEAFHNYLSNCNTIKLNKLWKNHLYSTNGASQGANWSEFLVCYQDLEEIKFLSDEDQIISRTTALVWRYKTMYESVRVASGITAGSGRSNNEANGVNSPNTLSNRPYINSNSIGGPSGASNSVTQQQNQSSALKSGNLSSHKVVEFSIWECMGKLKHIDIMNTPRDLLVNYITAVENAILSSLIEYFEGFLRSDFYREWQMNQVRNEKLRRNNSKGSLVSSHSGLQSQQQGTSPSAADRFPDRLPTCSAGYPNVLIVDDSTLTLKLTGLTLERDGHHVEKASNGEIALQLMSSNQYDVVLLDLNMPVMDGFETVRQFRQVEKQRLASVAAAMESFPSDVSSISDEDSSENAKDEENFSFYRMASSAPATSATRPGPTGDASGERDDAQNDPAPLLKVVEAAVLAQSPANLMKNHLLSLVPELKPKGSFEVPVVPYRQLIIGMSSNSDAATKNKALECGMDFFLPKPFTLEKFIETIRLSAGGFGSSQHGPPHGRDCFNQQQSILSSTSATSSAPSQVTATKGRPMGLLGNSILVGGAATKAPRSSLWSYH